MQVLHQTNKVPPGGWRYEVDGKEFNAHTLARVVSQVREFYFANDKIPPKDLDILIQDYVCKAIPDPEHKCKDISPPSKAELMVRATRALSGFIRSGFKLVTHEQLLDRREECEKCPHWNGEAAFGIGRCGSCGCYGLKMYATSETCPQNRWKELT